MQRFFLLLSILLVSGCATGRGIDEHVEFSPATKSKIYRDQWVHRSPPEVHVRPAHAAGGSYKVLFIPFRVTQPSADPNIMGYTVARVVWQTWLSMQLFPAMEFSGEPPPTAGISPWRWPDNAARTSWSEASSPTSTPAAQREILNSRCKSKHLTPIPDK